MKYRSDIDGLRAVAVVPVVLFHLGLTSIVPGGFAGVDIFFVISGFLITRIIYDGVNDGSYSVLSFYAKRIKRIFPALYVVYFFSIFAAFFLLFPAEIENVGKSILASIFFVSNIVFYFGSGYFDQKMEFNPMLHTWSLSVEEQFYILFPVLVFVLKKSSDRYRIRAIWIIAVLSLVCSEIIVRSDQMLSFYMVFSRAWELLVGALLALGGVPQVKNKNISNAIGFFGAALVFWSYLFLSKTTLFPGVSALPACVGAAALIYAGPGSYTGRFLSNKVFVFVGLISYSLYLWHWPIMVFWKIAHEPHGVYEKGGVLLLCFIAAVVSWWFVERPFRTKKHLSAARVVFWGSGVGVSVCALVGGVVFASPLLKDVPDAAENALGFLDYDSKVTMRSGECFLTSADKDVSAYKKNVCLQLSGDKPNVLIVGDSHAAHLWYGFNQVYKNINFMQATASGCKPVLGSKGEKRCVDLINFVYDDFLGRNKIDGVVISGRWRASDVDDVVKTALWLSQKVKHVYVSGPIVEYDQALPRVLAKGIYEKKNVDFFAHEHLREGVEKVDALFKERTASAGVSYISAFRALCAEGQNCILTVDENKPVQFDYGHLTGEGAIYLSKTHEYEKAFKDMR